MPKTLQCKAEPELRRSCVDFVETTMASSSSGGRLAMRSDKRGRLERAGWTVGNTDDFLGLTSLDAAYNALMTSRAQGVLREALMLSVDERADVAAELLASLDAAGADDPAAVEAAWAAEIETRARRATAGESHGVAWEDVRARAEAALKQS